MGRSTALIESLPVSIVIRPRQFYPPPPPYRNPFYKNERKTVEPHLLHKFEEDFYGSELRLLVTGYLRPEQNYPSLEALIKAIHLDIDTAKQALDSAEHQSFASGEEGKAALEPMAAKAT